MRVGLEKREGREKEEKFLHVVWVSTEKPTVQKHHFARKCLMFTSLLHEGKSSLFRDVFPWNLWVFQAAKSSQDLKNKLATIC